MSDGKINLSQWALGYLAPPPLVGWSWKVKLCIQDLLSVCIITIENKIKINNLKLVDHFLLPCWLIGRQLVQSVYLNFNCNRELHLRFYQMGVQTSMCQLLSTSILGHLLAFFLCLYICISDFDHFCLILNNNSWFFFVLILYCVSYMPLSGFHGILAGFLVGIKQIIPDQELPVVKIKAKVWIFF